MIITPGMQEDRASNLETSGGKVDLKRIKQELEDVRGETNSYFRRNQCALDWWQSRWEGQTVDGRKWWKWDTDSDIFPWKGSSDTRVRLTKMLINEYRTLCMHGLMNMKLQAQSTRPAKTARESQQATTLLNWQIFNHMSDEWHLETELAVVQAAAFGASVMSAQWGQERRLDHVPINVMQFARWVGQKIGQPIDILTMQDLLSDPKMEKELVGFIQDLSPILPTSKAKSILNDLRTLRYADVPVPYIFKSKPCLRTLQPMVDVFFAPEAYDLQKERWVDEIEYLTEAVLNDRLETGEYDPGFVKQAADLKGVYSQDTQRINTYSDIERGYNVIRPGNLPDNGVDSGGLIELHHFYHYSLDMGVPCLYKTVFHMELDYEAAHGVSEYAHGQMPFHAFRFETDQRPILSSKGIPEITYTWEQELKVQFDARTDRASIALSPPMFTPHSEMDKMAAFKPNARIPMRPGFKPEFAKPPDYDPGSIQVSQDIMLRCDRYFGWFGVEIDPQLKQLRQEQVVDRVLSQFKPVVQQIGMLDDQFLPDDVWLRVTGLPPRQGSRDRAEIQGQYEITMTCDLRERDNEFLKQKFAFLTQLKQLDTGGVLDANTLVKRAAEAIDYTLADEAIQQGEAATNKEVVSEIETANRIIGSGMPEPLPQAGNFQLRLQTLQNHLQQQMPDFPNPNLKRPDVQSVLKNRIDYFTRQLKQAENAQIGRLQVGNPFDSSSAPQITQGNTGGY